MNFLLQGPSLGRWFKIKVVISYAFLLYAGYELFTGGVPDLPINALILALLFGTVLVHEFGHALSCRAVGGEAHQIVLWPLGGIAFVKPPMNPTAWLITTVCGPLVNAIFWPLFYFASKMLIVQHFGIGLWDALSEEIRTSRGGILFPPSDLGVPAQICILMWQINKLLLLFNLIPGYPMDGGRILQELLWFIIGYPRSLMIAGMIGTAAGIGFVVIGLGLTSIYVPGLNFHLGDGTVQPILTVIGYLVAMQSFGIYRQSQLIQTWRKN